MHRNADQLRFFVRRAIGWTELHALPVGTVAYINSLAMVVAVADGFIGLTEWSLIDQEQVTEPSGAEAELRS